MMMSVIAVDSHAQFDKGSYVQLTTLDGLSDHRITSIVQDETGYIWIGTYEGLNRYDGLHFKKYFRNQDPLSLPNNFIEKLKYLGEDRLAIVTRGGMQVLQTKTNQTVNFIIPDTTAFGVFCNKFWDMTEVKGRGYLASTITGFYLFDYAGVILWRYDQYIRTDIHKFMRYGRELYELPDGKILCYYEDGGFAKVFDPATFQLFEVDPGLDRYKAFKSVVRHKKGSMAVAGPGQLMMTTPETDGVILFDVNLQKEYISSVPINVKSESTWGGYLVKADDSLMIQVGSTGGFFLLHKNAASLSVTSDGKRYFGENRCTAIFKDKDNRWWIGTEYGIFKQSFNQKIITSLNVRPHIEAYTKVKPVNVVHHTDGLLYFAAGGKDGVTAIDAITGEFRRSIRSSMLPAEWNDVFCIESLNKDTLWFGSREGLVYYDVRSHQTGRVMLPPFDNTSLHITGMFRDSRSNIWVSTAGQFTGVLLYDQLKKEFIPFRSGDTSHNLPIPFGTNFTEDYKGNIWIGKKGLARFNYTLMQFDTVINVFAGFQKYQNNVLGLSADQEGNLYLSTESNGLLVYSIVEKKFTHYTSPGELSRDMVLTISPSTGQKIYIGNRSHIDVFDIATHHVQVLGNDDGLPLAPISSAFFYDTTHQVYWAAYGDEIASIPVNIRTITYPLPNLLIESFSILNENSIPFPGNTIVLPYDKNSFRIDFTWLDFDGSDHVRTYYRLHKDDAWIDLNSSNTIILDHLASDKYDFEIKIKSITRRWPDQIRQLSIQINPPFWKATWFLLLMSTILAGGLYLLYRMQIRRIKSKATMAKRLAEYEMKALHSQMNPHFIFNCLNSIKEMILLEEKDKAGFYLSRFAQLIRDTLEHSKRNFISLEQLIDYLKRYIEMELIRFADFDYTITLDADVKPREIKMPPMLIQPLIENAIWHGLSHQQAGKKLDIHFFYRGDKLVCRITDNGIGISTSMKNKKDNHLSTGIENIYKRIELLNQKYQMTSSLTITDRQELDAPQQGTIAELSLFTDLE